MKTGRHNVVALGLPPTLKTKLKRYRMQDFIKQKKEELGEVLKNGITFSPQIHNYFINQSVFDWLEKLILEAQTAEGGQAEVLVMPKIAKIIKMIEDKKIMHEEKYKEFVNKTRNVMNGHWIKAETCKEIIKMIESNFTA